MTLVDLLVIARYFGVLAAVVVGIVIACYACFWTWLG